MAINQGFGPHFAWIEMSGGVFPLEHGSVQQNAQRDSSSFSGAVSMNYPGAYEAFSSVGDASATIKVSTRGQEGTLIVGEFLTIAYDFTPGIIRFAGHDNGTKLAQTTVNKSWKNKTGTEVIKELVGMVGLGFQGGGGNSLMVGKKSYQDFVKIAHNVSAASIIHQIAQFEGMRWWVSPKGVFHYMPIGSSTGGSYSLNYHRGSPMRADFMKLEVIQNIPAGSGIQVNVKSWNSKSKQVFESTSNVGSSPRRTGVKGQNRYLYHMPGLIQTHVKKTAESRAAELASHELKLIAEVVGDPSVDPSMSVSLSGTPFDQTYQIEEITHEIGMSGHRMVINAKSGSEGRSVSDSSDASSSTPLAALPSSGGGVGVIGGGTAL